MLSIIHQLSLFNQFLVQIYKFLQLNLIIVIFISFFSCIPQLSFSQVRTNVLFHQSSQLFQSQIATFVTVVLLK